MDTKQIKHIILSIPHNIKVMSCIIATQLLVIGVFKFWPVPTPEEIITQDIIYSDAIAIEEMVITKQEGAPPPPPKPRVPIPVPNDEEIEEELEFPEDLEFLALDESPFGVDVGKVGDSDKVVTNPQLSPNIIKIVEPPLPEEARKANINAKIDVRFLVGKQGQVEEAFIAQIRLFDKKCKEFEIVDQLGYGIMESTLEAALEWRFRPGKNDGLEVRTLTVQTFNIGC